MATTATTRATPPAPARWWVAGDWNAFFGLFTNVILNVIVLTTLVLFVVELPADDDRVRPDPAGARHRLPLGNLYYAYLARRLSTARGPQRCDRDAVRAERPAHVHRRLRDHAPDGDLDGEPDGRLAGGPRVGLHHRHRRPHRCLRRADDPPLHADRRHARHARRHLADLHLDAAGVPDVGSAVGRVHHASR